MAPIARGGRRYRGRTPEQLRNERRQRLLDAGLALFGERGYAKVPIEMLCASASVATRHFYQQFNSREALLQAVFDQVFEGAIGAMRKALAQPERTAHQRASDAIGQAVVFLLEDPRRGRVLCVESVGVSAAMEAHRRGAIHALASIIRHYAQSLADAGALPQRDYHIPAVALVGVFNELITEWLASDTGLDAGGMARETVLIFRAVIIGTMRYHSDWPPAVA